MSEFDTSDITMEFNRFASSCVNDSDPISNCRPVQKSFSDRIRSFFGVEPDTSFHPPNPIEGKKTLILDMDETLIHSADDPPDDKEISYFPVGDPIFYVYKRPGLDKFLKFCCRKFDTFIFTSGEREYAEPILNHICPFIDDNHRLYRDLCETNTGKVKKNLSIFQRPKKDLILIDDNIAAIENNPQNAIRIRRWRSNKNDKFLTCWLPPILEKCANTDDVRTIISKVSLQRTRFPNGLPLPQPHI